MKKLVYFILLLISISVTAQDFRFALISDIHMRNNDSLAYNDLKKCVDQINRENKDAFVIVSGDITEEGDKASLQRAKDILDQLKVKYNIVSGNHETKWSESGATDFGHIFGSERFEFSYKGINFLGFNTGPIIRMMDGHVAPQDIAWLDEQLSRLVQNTPVVIVTHYPLTPKDVDNWYEVTDVLRKYNIRAILGGHYHSNKLMYYDGIPGFINRSSLRDKVDNTSGYTVFELSKDSIVAYEQKIGKTPLYRGGYSLTTKYYTADNSGYERPNFTVNKMYPSVQPKWTTSIGKAIYASPTVANNKIYIGDDTGEMFCYSSDQGKKLWSFNAKNRILGTADVANNIVVFGAADNTIYALNATTGRLQWTFKTQQPVLGSATISEGLVYIGASDHTFRAIDLQTGKLKWAYTKVNGYIETKPLIHANNVIFGAWDNNLYALDKHTGKELWIWNGNLTRMHLSPAAVWAVAANNKIFITAPDRVMSAIDENTGKTVWRTNQSMVRETIGLSEDGLRVYSKTMQDSVVCYSTQGMSPQRLWITNVGYGYDHAASMPVEKDGVVFGSTKNGLIFALEATTGKLLWQHKVGNSLIGTVHPLSRNKCVFSSSEGIIGVLEAKE
ncbi:MAG: hypothetical protein RL662_18 [Bacteroidota bacterium]|jgi:outer membrane protein assembly factor BamB